MIRLVVVGAGGHGREIAGIAQRVQQTTGKYDLVGVVAESGDDQGLLAVQGLACLGGNAVLAQHSGHYIVGVGNPAVRRIVDERYSTDSCEPGVVVDPSAVIGDDVERTAGFVAFPQAVVTTNVRLGRHVHLNAGASVSHDCVLGDYVTLSPGCHLGGNVTLEDDVTLGIGAVVRQGVTVGRGTFVGAGAVVVSDLPAGVVAVGVPARPIAPQADA